MSSVKNKEFIIQMKVLTGKVSSDVIELSQITDSANLDC